MTPRVLDVNALDYLSLLLSNPTPPTNPTVEFLAVHSGLTEVEIAAVTRQYGMSIAACRVVAFACDAGVDFQTALELLPGATITSASYATNLVRMAGMVAFTAMPDDCNEALAAAASLQGLPVLEKTALAA